MHRRLRTLLAAGIGGVALMGCSSGSTTTPTTGTASPVNCAVVKSALASMTEAKKHLTTANDTTSKQIAAAVTQITTATEQLAGQSQSALPDATDVWLRATKAYDAQIQQGYKDGRSPTFLIQAAHSFDTAGYQNAAKAISAYLSTACP
jgi:hypothetical protein